MNNGGRISVGDFLGWLGFRFILILVGGCFVVASGFCVDYVWFPSQVIDFMVDGGGWFHGWRLAKRDGCGWCCSSGGGWW